VGISFVAASEAIGESGDVVLDLPAGVQLGDFLIAAIAADCFDVEPADVFTFVPLGWTQIAREDTGADVTDPADVPGLALGLYYKRVEAGDLTAPGFSWSVNGAQRPMSGMMLAYRGVSLTAPIGLQQSGYTFAAGGVVVLGEVTPAEDAQIVAVGAAVGYTAVGDDVLDIYLDPGGSIEARGAFSQENGDYELYLAAADFSGTGGVEIPQVWAEAPQGDDLPVALMLVGLVAAPPEPPPPPGPYEPYMEELAPPWLLRPLGKAFLRALGRFLDVEGVDRLKQAVKARFLETCPDDALDRLGRDRLLPRFPTETTAAYRQRLLAAWDIWLFAGTEAGLLQMLHTAYPGPAYSILENKDWDPAPPDGDVAYWSRAWIIIEPPFPWVTWKFGDGKQIGQPNLTIGTTMTPEEVALFRGITNKLKPAHVVVPAIILKIFGGPDVYLGSK
jgi:hypothetical protein